MVLARIWSGDRKSGNGSASEATGAKKVARIRKREQAFAELDAQTKTHIHPLCLFRESVIRVVYLRRNMG